MLHALAGLTNRGAARETVWTEVRDTVTGTGQGCLLDSGEGPRGSGAATSFLNPWKNSESLSIHQSEESSK